MKEDKKTENERADQYARDIINRSPAVAFVWQNAEGWPVTYVSDNVRQLFGWDRNDFLTGAISYAAIVHPDDLPRVTGEKHRYSSDKAADRVLHAPYRIVSRDGAVKWVEDMTTILRDREGRVSAFEGILIDITQRRQMEEQLELIQFSIDNAMDGISWIGPDARIIFANNEECRHLGYSREELLDMTAFDIDRTLSPRTWRQQWEELRRRGIIHREGEHRSKDGDVFPIESTIKMLQYRGKEFAFAFRRDISERKRIEKEQARLQANLANAVEIARLGPWEHDIVNDVFILNDYFYKIYHTTAEKVGGYTMSSDEFVRFAIHPEDASFVREEMERIGRDIDSRPGHQLEHRILCADGAVGYVAVRIVFVRDSDGRAVRSYGVNQDITERKLLERDRLASLKYFESMEKVNQVIQGSAIDLDQVLRDVLDICLFVFGCDRVFLLYPCDPEASFWQVPIQRTRPQYPGHSTPGELLPMDPSVERILRISLETPGPVSFGAGSTHPAPEEFWEKHGFRSQMVMALRPKVGKPWQFGLHQCSSDRAWTPEEAGLFEKIGRRLSDSLSSLLMYRDLRKSEAFLDSIVDNIPNTIIVKDAETLKFVRVNKACEKLLGFSREELIGKSASDLLPEEMGSHYMASDREVIGGGEPVDVPEETIPNRNGEPRILHTKKIPLFDESEVLQYLLIISEDITEFKRLQERLNQAQKMEALGTMAGGIAHDFNNILQPMIGYCEFLQEDLKADSPQQQFVDQIFKSALRAKDLVNQILSFSRQSEHRMMPVELTLVLKEAVKLCRSIIPSNIDIRLEIPSDCVYVTADPTQMHQIVMNLMINANHAMEQAGGKLCVGLTEAWLDEPDLKGIPLQPGGYARVSVSDSGSGIPPAVLPKIFVPHFTNKPQGKGTGLGLAVVYGIVKEHGGHIDVYSEEGKGTTFNIYVPLAAKSEAAPLVEKNDMHTATGAEHVLLVDDEAPIVQIERHLLERIGYRVTSCENGAEALAVFQADPNAFDLVITDMSMPGITGDQLTRELIAIRPDVPIIICTGFSEKIRQDAARAIGVKAFLMKPVTVSEMARKVRMVLDGGTMESPGA